MAFGLHRLGRNASWSPPISQVYGPIAATGLRRKRSLAGTGIELMKIGAAGSAAHVDWLAENVASGAHRRR